MTQRMLSRFAARLGSIVAMAVVVGGAGIAPASGVEDGSPPASVVSASGVLVAPHAAVLPGARPVDLRDPTPRGVEVRFEVSPDTAPGQLDERWSEARRGRLEPVQGGTLIRLRIPAAEIEAQMRSSGARPVGGSFSEFIWVIDPRSGDVLEATLEGHVRQDIRLGPIQTSALVHVAFDMSTRRRAGYRVGSGLLGLQTHGHCVPDAAERSSERTRRAGCVAVPAIPFDPARGYLNAVGRVRATSSFAAIEAFSPLGEIQITEGGSRGTEKGVSGPPLSGAVRRAHVDREGVRSGPSDSEAVCSRGVGSSCPADLGGES